MEGVRWLLCNDERVDNITEDLALSLMRRAYLLFYKISVCVLGTA
jgi:hypothetical protein